LTSPETSIERHSLHILSTKWSIVPYFMNKNNPFPVLPLFDVKYDASSLIVVKQR
jgi:hypothetical protein